MRKQLISILTFFIVHTFSYALENPAKLFNQCLKQNIPDACIKIANAYITVSIPEVEIGKGYDLAFLDRAWFFYDRVCTYKISSGCYGALLASLTCVYFNFSFPRSHSTSLLKARDGLT